MPVEPLALGSVIGILGGGQLGRLLAQAAAKLGFQTFVYAYGEDNPAFAVATRVCNASYGDTAQLTAFAEMCGAVTFEFESVPLEALETVARSTVLAPPAKAAATAQDRIAEKAFLTDLGIDVADHCTVENISRLPEAAALLRSSGEIVLKRSRGGYDGRDQARVSSASGLDAAFASLGGACIAEAVVPFAAEISVIAVRSADGAIVFYDVPENAHVAGILHRSAVPASVSDACKTEAFEIAARIALALDYVGVIAVEMFAMPPGSGPRLLVNEIAPRVHNTGHWTIDACTVSQFENHIRAVAGWPLGSVARHSDAIMTNLIGQDVLGWRQLLQDDPAASLYLYGKSGVRIGRKLGHVTRITPLHKSRLSDLRKNKTIHREIDKR